MSNEIKTADQAEGNNTNFDELEKELPSKLLNPEQAHRSIKRRIEIAKACVDRSGMEVGKQYKDDEHFWFTVAQNYPGISRILKDGFVGAGKNVVRKTAFKLAINNAEQIVARDFEKLTDGLTGAWSRKALDNYLSNLLFKSRRDYVGLFLFDIDHFKSINDTEGHVYGDNVLKKMVKILQEKSRSTDMVGRYGGEEFAVIAPNISIEGAQKKAESLRKDIKEGLATEGVKTSHGVALGVTTSIGVALMTRDDIDIKGVYERADLGLYAAKKEGRDRTMMFVEGKDENSAVFKDITNGEDVIRKVVE
jgi:diguanylate cyclase (GGDEF)-like protein